MSRRTTTNIRNVFDNWTVTRPLSALDSAWDRDLCLKERDTTTPPQDPVKGQSAAAAAAHRWASARPIRRGRSGNVAEGPCPQDGAVGNCNIAVDIGLSQPHAEIHCRDFHCPWRTPDKGYRIKKQRWRRNRIRRRLCFLALDLKMDLENVVFLEPFKVRRSHISHR